MLRDQKGFSLNGNLLLFLLVVLIGLGGYLVWHDHQTDMSTRTIPAIPSAPELKKEASSSYQTYENKELGFKFSYPDDWGEVTVAAPQSGSHGQLYKLSFDGKNIYVPAVNFVATKDWTPTQKQAKSLTSVTAADFQNRKACDPLQPGRVQSQVNLFMGMGNCLSVEGAYVAGLTGQGNVASLVISRAFTNNEKFSGIYISSGVSSLKDFSSKSLKSAFSPSIIQGYQETAQSLEEL